MNCLLVAFIVILISCNDTSTHQVSGNDTVIGKNETDTMQYGEMKKYWLVLLKKGTNRSQDSAVRSRIQAAHIANIDRLAAEKIIIMAGPMGHEYDHDLRGIFIMDAPDSATAASHIITDSAVITGSLRFEIHPWWTAKGRYHFN